MEEAGMLGTRKEAVGCHAATWGERAWFMVHSLRIPAGGASNSALAAGTVVLASLTLVCALYAAYAIKCALHIDMFPNAHLSDLIPG